MSVQWTDVVSAVATSLSVLVTGVLTLVIYRLSKRDTAAQRRSENESEAIQQIRRALASVGPLLSRDPDTVDRAELEKQLELLATAVHLEQTNLSGQDRHMCAQVYTALGRQRGAPYRYSPTRLTEFKDYLNKVSVYFSKRARGEEVGPVGDDQLPIFLFWDLIEYRDGTETEENK